MRNGVGVAVTRACAPSVMNGVRHRASLSAKPRTRRLTLVINRSLRRAAIADQAKTSLVLDRHDENPTLFYEPEHRDIASGQDGGKLHVWSTRWHDADAAVRVADGQLRAVAAERESGRTVRRERPRALGAIERPHDHATARQARNEQLAVRRQR